MEAPSGVVLISFFDPKESCWIFGLATEKSFHQPSGGKGRYSWVRRTSCELLYGSMFQENIKHQPSLTNTVTIIKTQNNSNTQIQCIIMYDLFSNTSCLSMFIPTLCQSPQNQTTEHRRGIALLVAPAVHAAIEQKAHRGGGDAVPRAGRHGDLPGVAEPMATSKRWV